MRLWYLVAEDDPSYDEYDSFVVRAETENDARRLARATSGEKRWTIPKKSTCKELFSEGEEKIIIGSFNAG